jgi:hypothetical protein
MHGNLAKPISLQEIAATLLASARFIFARGFKWGDRDAATPIPD